MSDTSLTNDLDGHWPLDTDGSDVSGNDLDGTLEGGASITSSSKVGSGSLTLGGDGDFLALPNSDLINTADARRERTLSVWFKVDDPSISSRKQVVFEEGGPTRGLNIYVYDGKLYVGGWNVKESEWAGTFLSTTNIQANTWHHVVLTLNGNKRVEENALAGYLDGNRFGLGKGSKVWDHGGDVAAGAVYGDSRFHDGSTTAFIGHELVGTIDDLRLYNRALGKFEVQALYDWTENNLVAWHEFDGTAEDATPQNNDATLDSGASLAEPGVVGGYLSLDGSGRGAHVPDTEDINLGIHERRTVSLWFYATDPDISSRKQVLFEEGGGDRGINLYLYDGALYGGGWNDPNEESDWEGDWISTSNISAGQWHHAAIVLDGTDTVQSGALELFLDGSSVGTAPGSQIWEHPGDIGIGSRQSSDGTTRFHDEGVSRDRNAFEGRVDGVRVYNTPLTGQQITDRVPDLSGGDGMRGVYYENADWTGDSLVRTDDTVDFDWGTGSPDSSIGSGEFSAVWNGRVQAQYDEKYTFITRTNGGVRLWVNGRLVVDNPVDEDQIVEQQAQVSLNEGEEATVRMEYFKNTGEASATLSWASPSSSRQVIPTHQMFSDDQIQPQLEQATSNSDDLTKVYLRYNRRMEQETAADPANYSLSDGLSVQDAQLGTFKTVVTLTASGDVTTGSTEVTVSDDVLDLTQEQMTETTVTIVEGNSDGFATSNELDVALATDDNGRVIVDREEPSFDVEGANGEELMVTAPGTDPIDVTLKQQRLPGGTSEIVFPDNGQEQITLTTSGGDPNRAITLVKFLRRGSFKDDLRITAEVDGELRGDTTGTCVTVDVTPKCVYLQDQRSVEQTLKMKPGFEGVTFQQNTHTADLGKGTSAPTFLFSGDWPDTDANGEASQERMPCGTDEYDYSCNTPEGDRKESEDPCAEDSDTESSDSCPCSCCPDKVTCTTEKDEESDSSDGYEGHNTGNGNSIDPSDGEKKLTITPWTIEGRGLNWRFGGTYRSHDYREPLKNQTRVVEAFGENWTTPYIDEYLIKDDPTGQAGDDEVAYLWSRPNNTITRINLQEPGEWATNKDYYMGFTRDSDTGDLVIRNKDGTVYRFFGFDGVSGPKGRLKSITDRNDNQMTFHYEALDPDGSGDTKQVLAFVIDTLGREIRYRYYASSDQTVNGRQIGIGESNSGAFGRLAEISDFKGDMDFSDNDDSEDFAGQTNNRTFKFDYDAEGHLVRCSEPAITGTPNGNDFPNGKTFRYRYISEVNPTDNWSNLSAEQKDQISGALTHVWYPNEVRDSVDTDPAEEEARQIVTYITDPSNEFFGYADSWRVGDVDADGTSNPNGNGVPAGGTHTYEYDDLNPDRDMPGFPHDISEVETLRTTVTDRNGNVTEYTYNGDETLRKKVVRTNRDVRSGEPDYTTTEEYNGRGFINQDRIRTNRTNPEGNSTGNTFNQESDDRFQQGNKIRSVQTPDTDRAPNDQSKIETVSLFEPIYNQTSMRIDPRGVDVDNNGFTPPVEDPNKASRQITDPYDSDKTIDLRYATVHFFDYQESTEKATNAPDSRTDKDGSGGQVNNSPLIDVDSDVLTVEVWLVQELGLDEDSDGLSTLRNRLSNNRIKLGLGDLNGDGNEEPRIGGNVIRTVKGSPVLIEGSNQHAIETEIESAGDLVDAAADLINGGAQEGTHTDRLQTIVSMRQYNEHGQILKEIDPEGNVNTYEYYPATDPDGDGVNTPSPADGRTLDSSTGGYLKKEVLDDSRSYFDQSGNDQSGARFTNNNTDPVATQCEKTYTYDDVGNVITETDGRGIRTDYFVNEHDQVIKTTRAADISDVSNADPSDPLFNLTNSEEALTAFQYVSQTYYDFNNQVVLEQTEDRGNTSDVDGQGVEASEAIPAQATDTTPGLSTHDASGDKAFVDTLYLYDRLDNRIEQRREVRNDKELTTLYRYDHNENRVFTVQPAGNATARLYDERDLLFQETEGAQNRPSPGLFADDDPTSFDRPGGDGTEPSTTTHNYDGNRNLIEQVDAEDTEGSTANNSDIAGEGDVQQDIQYDGFDRKKIVTDAMGNKTVYTYDPASNVIRTRRDGDPVNDTVGSSDNKTLEVTEQVHDALDRVIATHRVLFETPEVTLNRSVTLTDNTDMNAFAPYLSDASTNDASVPDAIGITVIGRVTSITEYDRKSRQTFTIEDDLDVNRTDYDGKDRTIRTLDSHVSTGFDASSGTFNPSNLLGNAVLQAYDDNDNVIETREFDVLDLNGDGTADAFDANGDGTVDGSDQTFDADLDGTKEVHAEVFRTTMLYDSLDRLQTRFDNRGQTHDMRYDSRNNQVAQADAQGPTDTGRTFDRRWTNPFDGSTDATTVDVNGYGNVTRYVYDGINRQLETDRVLTASGEGDGNNVGASLEGEKDVGGASGIPTPDTSQSGDGLISTYQAWDDNSQILARRDDNGNTTLYIYDNQNRQILERKGVVITGTDFSIAADDSGQLTTPSGDSGSFRTSLKGGESVVDTEPDGTDVTVEYDRDNNVVKREDEDENLFEITYDALNRQKQIDVTRASGFEGTTKQTFKYDGLSRQTETFDNNDPSDSTTDVTCTYAYDSLSRKVEETQQVGSSATVQVVTCAYDIEAGNAVEQPTELIYPDGRVVESTYDELNRLLTFQDQGQTSPIATYRYIGPNRVAKMELQNGTRLTHLEEDSNGNIFDPGYDNLRRTTLKRWEDDSGTLGNGNRVVGFQHLQDKDGDGNVDDPGYDRMNNKLLEEKTHDTDNSEIYNYDSVYRVTDFERGTLKNAKDAIATQTNTPNQLQSQAWNLDGVNNWNSTDHTTGGTTDTENRDHTDFNEIEQVSGTSYGDENTGTHQLDKNGNITDDNKREIKYDAFNRVKEVIRKSDGQTVAEYTYDSMNRRFRKVVSNSGIDGNDTNGTTEYFYKDWQTIEEQDGSDSALRQYVYGRYIDEPLTLDDRSGGQTVADLNDGSGDDRLFYHCNTQYSTFALTDEAGSIVEGYQYDAYGRQTVITDPGSDGEWFTDDDTLTVDGDSAVDNPYMFQGRRFDGETELHYYRNRYYNSRLGRFISRDPKGTWFDILGYGNGYASLIPNPVLYTDPYGFWGIDVHGEITRKAFSSDNYDPCLIDQIVDENQYADEINIVGMFIPGTGNPNVSHYTRAIETSKSKGVMKYRMMLQNRIMKFVLALNQDDCEKALDHLGIYLHFRQDFFAQAVEKDNIPGNEKSPEGWDIYSDGENGTLRTPNPDNPQGTYPASYPSSNALGVGINWIMEKLGIESPAEHPVRGEPINIFATPEEKRKRKAAAILDTKLQRNRIEQFKEHCCVCEDVE